MLVDGERDRRRAKVPDERQHAVKALPTVLHVHGVDDDATRRRLEGRLQNLRLGRVNDERRLHGLTELTHDPRHQIGLVAPLSHGHADVQGVRPAFGLLARQGRDAVVVLGEEKLFGLFAALRVQSLADEHGRRLLQEAHRRDAGGDERQRPRWTRPRALALDPLDELLDVVGRGPAASANDAQAELVCKLPELG